MQKKDKILIVLMLILLTLIIVSESRQRRINWFPSFSVKHKIPFGSYVAYQEAKKIFKDDFQPVSVSPYVFLSKNPDAAGTYVLYNSQINLGKTALESLLTWVKKGNHLLISSGQFEQPLLDSLHLDQSYYIPKAFNNRLVLDLVNPALKIADSVIFDKISTGTTIISKDSLHQYKIKISGEYVSKDTLVPNFVDVQYGKGHIMLHSLPYVFTNYFILKNHNSDYFEGILSYINQKKPVYWDIEAQNGAGSAGIFKYIIQNPGFLWAYRLLFIGLLVYVLFEGKRKQRAIPVVAPPKNETLAFTKTIGDMYIENKEHRRIALMHIKHFMDYLRTQLHIDTKDNIEILKKKIAQKTKTEIKDIDELFDLIYYINQNTKITSQTVLDLDQKINKVKDKK